MNLVEVIKSQLSGALMNQLSSLIGAGEGATKSAVNAAVPALLAALSKLVSSGDGIQKLLAALGKFDLSSMGDVASKLADNPNAVQEQGGGLLNSLLGGSGVAGIANALARFAGIGPGSIQKLLGYLAPLVLGAIASRFAGKTINAQGLTSLFNEQKANIADAMPSGFSLADVPGMAAAGQAVRTTTGAVQEAGPSLMKWLLPLIGLAALALVLYLVWPKSTATPTPTAPRVPDVTQVTGDLTSTFSSLTDSMQGITDAASAAKALPKLRELSGKLDEMKATVDKLPAEGKAKVADLIKSTFGKLEDQFARLQWIPGAQTVIDQIMGKMASLGGVSVPQLPQVSGELANTITAVTEALTGIKDSAMADAALPKLQDIDKKLDGTKATVDKMSDASKATLASLIKAALGRLREVVDKVLAVAGVGDKIKPAVEAIMGKLTTLAG